VPTMSFNFEGRSVIITGGARGIGLELVRYFGAAGAATWLVDRDADELESAAADTGARGMVADVSNSADVARVVADVIDRTGRIDVLVNNAGILRDAMLWKLSDDDWDSVLAVHLGGTFRFTRACVPHFRTAQQGRIVNVTSYTGLHGNVGQAAYAAAKAGIIGFTKTAAKELAAFGVTVNAISPNAETRMIDSIPRDTYERIRQSIPMGRFGEPGEMCSAVAFLASDEAAYVTGIVLPVDGGVSM
jgi:3-oxoacyl-[acyl-carrier protein] reductase